MAEMFDGPVGTEIGKILGAFAQGNQGDAAGGDIGSALGQIASNIQPPVQEQEEELEPIPDILLGDATQPFQQFMLPDNQSGFGQNTLPVNMDFIPKTPPLMDRIAPHKIALYNQIAEQNKYRNDDETALMQSQKGGLTIDEQDTLSELQRLDAQYNILADEFNKATVGLDDSQYEQAKTEFLKSMQSNIAPPMQNKPVPVPAWMAGLAAVAGFLDPQRAGQYLLGALEGASMEGQRLSTMDFQRWQLEQQEQQRKQQIAETNLKFASDRLNRQEQTQDKLRNNLGQRMNNVENQRNRLVIKQQDTINKLREGYRLSKDEGSKTQYADALRKLGDPTAPTPEMVQRDLKYMRIQFIDDARKNLSAKIAEFKNADGEVSEADAKDIEQYANDLAIAYGVEREALGPIPTGATLAKLAQEFRHTDADRKFTLLESNTRQKWADSAARLDQAERRLEMYQTNADRNYGLGLARLGNAQDSLALRNRQFALKAAQKDYAIASKDAIQKLLNKLQDAQVKYNTNKSKENKANLEVLKQQFNGVVGEAADRLGISEYDIATDPMGSMGRVIDELGKNTSGESQYFNDGEDYKPSMGQVPNVNSRPGALNVSQDDILKAGSYCPPGTDCSAFTQNVFKNLNLNIPRTAITQYNATQRIAKGSLEAGDLVFFDNGRRDAANTKGKGIGGERYVNHVGIYLGNGQFMHDPGQSSDKNRGKPLDLDSYLASSGVRYIGGGRVTGSASPKPTTQKPQGTTTYTLPSGVKVIKNK